MLIYVLQNLKWAIEVKKTSLFCFVLFANMSLVLVQKLFANMSLVLIQKISVTVISREVAAKLVH